ncbi:MAG: YchJ family metal-binding protein [Chloroflexota bacterium]
MNEEFCSCNSLKLSHQCCQPLLEGKAKAATPEALMRSRYTAFCQGNIDYLIRTHHPSKRHPDDEETLQKSMAGTEWLGLKVIKAPHVKKEDITGIVEFAAFYNNPTLGQLHECSEFVLKGGQWYYLQGEILPPITLSRNELCWCGSNKKFKKCHGR